MKRTIRREEKIDSFEIGIEDLALLINQLKKAFQNENDIRVSIEMEFGEETWDFGNVDEIRKGEISEKQCSNFELAIHGRESDITISSKTWFSANAEMTSCGDNVGWCAGINETAKNYLQKYRVWHYWMGRKAVASSLFLLSGATIAYYNDLTGIERIDTIVTFLVLGSMWIAWNEMRAKWFPGGIILLNNRRSDTRNTIFKWSIIVGVIAIVVGAISAVIDTLALLY